MTWDCSLISAARIVEHLRLLHAGARCARLPRGDATLRVVGAALGAHGAVPVLAQRRAAVCTYRTAPDGRLLHARRGEEAQPSAYSLARLRSNAGSSKRSVRHHRCELPTTVLRPLSSLTQIRSSQRWVTVDWHDDRAARAQRLVRRDGVTHRQRGIRAVVGLVFGDPVDAGFASSRRPSGRVRLAASVVVHACPDSPTQDGGSPRRAAGRAET